MKTQEAARPEGSSRAHGWLPGFLLLLCLVLAAGCLARRKPDAPEPPPLPKGAVARAYLAPDAARPPAKKEPLPPRAEGELLPPAPSTKDARRQTYDPERPCFTRGEMARSKATLFRGAKRPDTTRWLDGLNLAFHELGADCTDHGFLLVVLTIIQQESGVRVDPPLENPDLEKLLAFKLQRLKARNALAARLLNATGIQAALKAKLRADSRRARLKTEGDLVRYVEEDLRVWFAAYLHREFSVPEPLARLAARIGITTPINTIGPMQVNVSKAYRNALARGDGVGSPAEMRGLLLAPETALTRGLKEGVDLVWKSFRFYRGRLPPERAAYFAGTDFNAGEFSSRNAAFQERVALLSGRPLALDGDLLLYREGRPATLISKTESAVMGVLGDVTGAAVREDLRLEKGADFTDSLTERRICQRFVKQTGRACTLARLPEGAGNETARVKLGRSYSPANYARAFLRRLRANRKRFGGD